MNWKKVGARIKEARKRRSFTLATLSSKLNVSEGHFSRYEKGEINIPLEKLQSIAQFLNVSDAWLLGMEDRVSGGPHRWNAVPIYKGSTAKSGALTYTYKMTDYYLDLDRPHEFFILAIEDMCMGPIVKSGDLALVASSCEGVNNEAVAAFVEGYGIMIRWFYQKGDTILLMPENPNAKIFVLSASTPSNYQIMGNVQQFIVNNVTRIIDGSVPKLFRHDMQNDRP